MKFATMLLSRSEVKRETLIKIAITPGEPAGIGPDICIQTFNHLPRHIQPVYFVDPDLLRERAELMGMGVTVNDLSESREFIPTAMNVVPSLLQKPCEAGFLDPANSAYVMETLNSALQHCLDGKSAALVTGPVNKSIICDAGIPFTGHTEWLAERTGTKRVVMMLASQHLRVVLATTHLPLREVADAINKKELTKVIEITMSELTSKFGIERPRLMVCGLNPHSGEGGHLGKEEIEVITPVIEELVSSGMDLVGPVPADTAFTPAMLSNTDAVLAMYHDQGLPVLKHQGFGEAVNITLGLPIIRTSVDHGTALDLAGTGKAETGSLLSAIESAAMIVAREESSIREHPKNR